MRLPPGPVGLPVPAVCLVVLDGWGLAPPGPGNAVELADTPCFDELWKAYPHTELEAGGRSRKKRAKALKKCAKLKS